MKRFVCKERIKTGIQLIFIELLFSILITIFILFMCDFQRIVMPIIIGLISFIIMMGVTLIEIKQYCGKISINNDEINLFLFNKCYSFNIKQICIFYINYEMTPRFTGKKLYSVKIRIKGEKNIIPIKIMDEDIIKELLKILIIRREPQDFKFDWEQ